MINQIRFPEYSPNYWDEEFENYRNDIENWRNYQIEDQMYNPYTRDDLDEQRRRDYYRGYEEEVAIMNRSKYYNPIGRSGPYRKSRIQKQSSEHQQAIHHHRRLVRDPHYPQRGNTDPFAGQSWVY